ncbi:hypothetical protein [Natrarchaeobaculum sulfurireducens]|uniref:Uncharacterized protein n=1 Tax=Natrarchaeobaculum sulfurireducens TaxID=2044521 RepID=A0A346P9I7_9EURY|nr:hypothetical protein [Natrarchaeobaculum sulfurireducens]AXR76182.1 hypothetical protein AArc1_4065 [Natrarchaeobaculum sulfurireducens]
MGSKTYEEERECNECGSTYTASVYIGVGQDTTDGLCRDCYSSQREERIERILSEHDDKWYRPDSEDKEIAVYKPDGGRADYKHDIHAVQNIESWYGK